MQAYGTGICTQPCPSLFCKLFNTTFMQDSPACESCRPPSSRYPSVLGSPWPVLPFSSVRFLLPLAFSSVLSPLHIFVFPCPALSVLSFSRSCLLSGLGGSFGYRTVTCRPWHPTLSVLSLLAWSSHTFYIRCRNYFSFANLAPASFGKYWSPAPYPYIKLTAAFRIFFC